MWSQALPECLLLPQKSPGPVVAPPCLASQDGWAHALLLQGIRFCLFVPPPPLFFLICFFEIAENTMTNTVLISDGFLSEKPLPLAKERFLSPSARSSLSPGRQTEEQGLAERQLGVQQQLLLITYTFQSDVYKVLLCRRMRRRL